MRRSLLLILDAMTTAMARPDRKPLDSWRLLVGKRVRQYDRVGLAMHLFYSVVPGCASFVSTLVRRRQRLPFPFTGLPILNYGTDSSVFGLELPTGRYVLKIERHSLGRNISDLMALARFRKTAYRRVTRLYQGPFEFFPATDFVVMHGLLFGSPVVAAIQPWVAGRMQDLLGDFTDEQLVEELSKDEHLHAQFVFFLERTKESHRVNGWVVDLLGASNLMVVETDGVRRLISVDSGMINFRWLKRNYPEKYTRYLAQVERMTRIAETVEAARQVAV